MMLTLTRLLAAIVLTSIFFISNSFSNLSAAAMDFTILPMPDGLRVVFAKGDIVAGDVERFRVALKSSDRDPFGNKELALNSNGGLVSAAFEIVALMDREKVATIVPPFATCASACVAIFLAGAQRVVLDGGRLGMHSCASIATGARSELCNDRIAQSALEHGTEFGSVMAFIRYAGPSEMIWFSSQDSDCWGLTRWPPQFKRGIQPGETAPCVGRAFNNLNK